MRSRVRSRSWTRLPAAAGIFALTLGSFALPPEAFAVPQYRDDVRVDSNLFFKSAGGSSCVPTSSTLVEAEYPWSAGATATSAEGMLSTASEARRSPGGFGGYALGRATPSFLLDGLMPRKLPGYEDLPDSLTVGAQIQLEYRVTHVEGVNELILQGGINSLDPLGTFSASTSTPIVVEREVAVGDSFTIWVQADQRSSVQGDAVATSAATATISLNAVSVFILPEGYTVDGAGGAIVDNRIPALIPAPVPVVPPLGIGLLAIGLAGLGMRAAARHANSTSGGSDDQEDCRHAERDALH